MKHNLIWVDTETTGLHPADCAIIQIAAIRKDGKTFCETVKPHWDAVIEPTALKVNGRTAEEIRGYADEKHVAIQFLDFIAPQAPKIILAGHNMKFDWDFLKSFFGRVKLRKAFESLVHYNFLDTLPLALALQEAGILNTEKSYMNLGSISEFLKIKNEKAHDALGDVRCTKDCYEKMIELISEKIYV